MRIARQAPSLDGPWSRRRHCFSPRTVYRKLGRTADRTWLRINRSQVIEVSPVARRA